MVWEISENKTAKTVNSGGFGYQVELAVFGYLGKNTFLSKSGSIKPTYHELRLRGRITLASDWLGSG